MGVATTEIQDVTQETFLAMSLALPDFIPERAGSFRTWVRGIARHKALDHFRRSRGEVPAVGGTVARSLIEGITDGDSSADADDEEVSGLYCRALDLIRVQFEDRTWKAFWRHAVDTIPADTVAKELAMSPVAVRVAKSRVLARLREEFGALIN
jgi:RNA polymerase sigma-70 factor, ECF subfamily